MTDRLSRGAVRTALLALLLGIALLPATVSNAQELLRGRVVKGGAAVGGVPVTLHRVTRDTAGAVRSGVTAPDGSFSLPLPKPDGSGFTVFFVTAEFEGVRYFGNPLHATDPRDGYTVRVYDAVPASTAGRGAVRALRRDVVILPDEDGGAEVDELLRVHNARDVTLVSDGLPTWEFRLPEGAGAFEVGEGEISGDAVKRKGDRVLVVGSLTPGSHELFVRYRLPRGAQATVFPLAAGTDSMNVLVRQPSAEATVAGFSQPKLVEADGEKFLRYSGGGLAARREVVVAWDRPGAPPVDPRYAAVGVVGVVLAGGAGLAFRRRPAAKP